ncbi:HxlR family transcriptional regulator [Sphingomonas sp. LM7]|nr:HxlR family transcriptional regulator [Sphingomonas sp. LM7]
MKRLKASYGCPVELALDFVGGKWKTVILARLKEEPHRYADLRTRIDGISDKVLTERLRDLERLELVEKRSAPDASTVYHLTDLGESLRPVLDALYRWGHGVAEALPATIRQA